MTETPMEQMTEARAARIKWWADLSRKGDPLHQTDLWAAFETGYTEALSSRAPQAASVDEQELRVRVAELSKATGKEYQLVTITRRKYQPLPFDMDEPRVGQTAVDFGFQPHALPPRSEQRQGPDEPSRAPQAGGEGRGRCPECGRRFDPPISQCPTCAVPLKFPTPADAPKGDVRKAYMRGISDAAQYVRGVPEDETVRCTDAFLSTLAASIEALSTSTPSQNEALDGVHAVGYREGFMTAEMLRRADREALRRALDLTAFVLEDAATVVETIDPQYKEVAAVWMKQVRRARKALSTPSQAAKDSAEFKQWYAQRHGTPNTAQQSKGRRHDPDRR